MVPPDKKGLKAIWQCIKYGVPWSTLDAQYGSERLDVARKAKLYCSDRFDSRSRLSIY